MESLNTASVEQFLAPYLPRPAPATAAHHGVFVTATWAQSLDARIAAAPGQRTQLSGLYTKKMTHYLRSVHDGILVGKNTVLADDPSLNCRYAPGAASPRPIVLDSGLAWPIQGRRWKVLANARSGQSPGPWVVVDREVDPAAVDELRAHGGDIVRVQDTRSWPQICAALRARGIRSLMVEGGAAVLDGCLRSGVPSSVIITLAPVFLGNRGVEVSPARELRPAEPRWWREDDVPDSVYAAKLT